MLTVFFSHSGKTLELECSSETRVDDVQETLAALTGVPPPDQILTCEGVPLASGTLLASYGLYEGGESAHRKRDVFLYSRSLLRQDASMPSGETFPPKAPDPAPPPQLPLHPLDSANSPLLRAVPQYCRQFAEHLHRARVAADAGAARVALCCRLVNEAEVQALSVDAAMASVEPHYAYICNAQATFQEKFARRFAAHEDILDTFEADMDFLHSVELPPSLASDSCARLSDLIDGQDLRRVAAECARSHRHFAARVSQLDALHAGLRSDIETLFMRTPTVDLDDLSQGLASAQAAADELATTAQALQADLARAERALEEGAAGSPSMTEAMKDTVGMLEAMHESHVAAALPRVAECATAIDTFAERCLAAKNALATDALRALRNVASQQSRIREMREAMAPFPAALERQDAQVARLHVVRRLPPAYKQCLAECARRAAFNEKYAAFAADLAERMGRFRQKEVAVREKFGRHVADLIPASLLHAMGLDQPPPYCQVGVTGDEASRLLQVTPDELQRLQLPRRPSIGVAASTSAAQEPSPRGVAPVAWMREQPSGGGGAAASTSSSSALSSLQVENARLRAELASHIALDCIRAAEAAVQAPPVPSPAPSAPPSPRPMDGSMGVAAPSAAAGIIPAHQSQAQGLPLGPDAAIKFELALAAKDALLREQAAAAAGEAASLRERVAQLEAQLAARSLHSAQSSGADASMTTVKPGEQLDPGEVHMKPSEDREASQVAGSQEEGGNPAAHGESSCE